MPFKCHVLEEIEKTKYYPHKNIGEQIECGGKCGHTSDAYLERFFWHMKNCTCFIMEFYYYDMIEQDNHIRDYLRNEKLMDVQFSPTCGVTYYFFDDLVNNLMHPLVRSFCNYYRKEEEEKQRSEESMLETRIVYIDSEEYREMVRKNDPTGDFCARCGKKNNFWDDCGWFYAYGCLGSDDQCAVCRECWNELGCTTAER